MEEIVSLEKSDIKLALVEYRDHPPQDTTFVVRVHDFTESVKEMKGWLEQCKAQGGREMKIYKLNYSKNIIFKNEYRW